MKFVSDPDISVKIERMKSRVRWGDDLIKEHQIDRTKLVIEDENRNSDSFSFLVIGDSGCGSHLKHHPQRKIAKMMLKQQADTSFILHTGDVVYQVGSSEYYRQNFIDPYREFIVKGKSSAKELKYDSLTFKLPFFLVPGNHDYYNLPLVYGLLAQATWLPRRFLRRHIDLDVGWHGSDCGNAYAKAFLDYLADLDRASLKQHLKTHYTAERDGDRCLFYQPGKFTRLPNRYYTFRYGSVDFFALDSNTFNQPLAIPDTVEGMEKRQQLLEYRKKLENRERQIEREIDKLDTENPDEAEQIDDLQAKIEHIGETQRDIIKQLNQQQEITDWEQLDWLKKMLIASWQDKTVKGRIIFLHHPPYVTEATKWDQGQTLAIRDRLRQVFDRVIEEIDPLPEGRSVVDIVISGHAHCLEHLYTKDTQYGDSYINWLVCGGSGHSLRRQRKEGVVLYQNADLDSQAIGQSCFYVGLNGRKKEKKRPYSFLRIDVNTNGDRAKFTVNPYIAERYRHQWQEHTMKSFTL